MANHASMAYAAFLNPEISLFLKVHLMMKKIKIRYMDSANGRIKYFGGFLRKEVWRFITIPAKTERMERERIKACHYYIQ
jgi:hypothetical protein